MIMRGDAYGRLASGLVKTVNDKKTEASMIMKGCITSPTTKQIYNVQELISSLKTANDWNKWCTENGGTKVCEGNVLAFTGIMASATSDCPS